MNKLESAKIIYKQDGYCKQKSAGGLAVPCDDCFLYPEYCDKRGIANVKSRELAKQYIAEEKPKAKPEHKPCPRCKGTELQALCNFINCCTCGINNNNGKIKSSNEAWDDWDRDFDMEG